MFLYVIEDYKGLQLKKKLKDVLFNIEYFKDNHYLMQFSPVLKKGR